MPNIVVFGSSLSDFTMAQYCDYPEKIKENEPIEVHSWPYWFGEYYEDVHVYNYARCTHGLPYAMHMMDLLFMKDNASLSDYETCPDSIDLAILEIPCLTREFVFCGPDQIQDRNDESLFIRHKYKNNYTISTKTPTLLLSKLARLENTYQDDSLFDMFSEKAQSALQSLIDGMTLSIDTRIQAQIAKTMMLEYYKSEFKRRFNCELLVIYWNQGYKGKFYPNNFSEITEVPEVYMRQYENVLHDRSHLNTKGSEIFFNEYFLKSNKFQEISKNWIKKVN